MFLGVDGGGTKTAYALIDATGGFALGMWARASVTWPKASREPRSC